MRLEYQILLAVAADALIGDPRWWPHPVRGIGRFARAMEGTTRQAIRSPLLAGILTVLVVVGGTGALTWGVVHVCARLHATAGDIAAIFFIYTAIAARDLARHAMEVYSALGSGDLVEARKRVARIVGRDTESLDEAGVSRAAVESVAESIVDGITAPLFYAVIAGPVGAMAYRAVNTLDSTFGYTN